MNAPNGILLVDKPGEWTSHDVVARVRRLAGTRKVGHAGTLDPMATGLLILGLGASTRLLTYVVGVDKEYTATIRLGAATTTDDAEGETVTQADRGSLEAVTDRQILTAVAALTGSIQQVPSAVSAIKVDGKRSYARVRAGESVELAARAVTVAEFEVLASRRVEPAAGEASPFIDLDVRVVCSSGTYIRALARDLGASLGVGGHLTALRRTRVGPFVIADASPLQSLDATAALITPTAAASKLFARFDLSQAEAVDLGHGKRIELPAALRGASGPIAAVAPDGKLVALVEERGPSARVLVGFPSDVADHAMTAGAPGAPTVKGHAE